MFKSGDCQLHTKVFGNNSYIQWRLGSGQTVEIYDIMTNGRRRRTGIGRKMINFLKQHVTDNMPRIRLIFAITRIDNYTARKFYENTGFNKLAELQMYLDDPKYINKNDAVIYGLTVRKRS